MERKRKETKATNDVHASETLIVTDTIFTTISKVTFHNNLQASS